MRKLLPPLLSAAGIVASTLALVTCSETPPFSPSNSSFSASYSPPIILAAGDIASCDHDEGDVMTAALINTMPAATVLTLGDNAYDNGTAVEYANCYEPNWGQFKDRTRPSLGNHEYATGDATASFDYFGDAAWGNSRPNGYYSFDLGTWHIVVLNDNNSFVSIGASSAQVKWLKADLAATTKQCIMAVWHQPLFSSAYAGGTPGYLTSRKNLWGPLYEVGADLILNAHKHVYERYGLQDPAGNATPQGIRQITVGTGGDNTGAIPTVLSPNAEVVHGGVNRFGVLKVTLHEGSYAWEYLPVGNNTFTDQGQTSCHTSSPPSAARSTATVPAAGVAGSSTLVTVQARDASGQALTTGGANVAVRVSGANSVTPSVTDNGDGTYTAQYTPINVGTDSLEVTMGGAALGGSPYLSVVAPKIVKIGPSKNTQTVPVGTAVPAPPSVRVSDGAGTPLGGITVTFTVLSGGGTVVPTSVTSNANGEATVQSWTLGPVAGTNKVRAAVSTSSRVDFWALGE
jgi:hypothetical protein